MELEAESGDFHTQIPDRALNVYFPRTPVLDRYRAGIVKAGFDDRLVWFWQVASGIHTHGAASGLREASFLNVIFGFRPFPRTALWIVHKTRRRLSSPLMQISNIG
mgnify:FL=1